MMAAVLVMMASHPALAQSTWTGGGADQNWSTSLNWSGIVPLNDAVTFPDGASPVTASVQGAVNNIVQSSTAITSLAYNNDGAASHFVTTQIPSGSTLTVNGNVTAGNAAVAVFATITGGGSLMAGTGASTLAVQSTSGTATLDLSPLSTFVFNFGGAGGPVTLGTSTGGRGVLSLAAGSNNITATTLSIGNNNTSGPSTLNLGNGTNILNADTFRIGIDKTTGTMQFLNAAGGGLKIADHTGAGRAQISLGATASTGSTGTSDNGNMLFTGGAVNILASTLTNGSRLARAGAGSANGVLAFDSGIVDITTIKMAVNTSGGSAANGTISVGGGTLLIGSGGLSLANQAGAAGTGTLNITSGGAVICSNNIFKTTVNGTGTISMSNGSLTMASLVGTIGVSTSVPIDNFNLTNSALTLPVATSANVAVANFNPDATTQNTINVSSMPSITAYPSQFPIITYTTPGGNLNSLVLGALPGTFTGFISNNTASFSIDLVVTNGPSAAKADEWGGGVNNQWDTTSLNWTNAGAAVAYHDLDFVTFDDLGQTGTVNLTAARMPATLEVNNNVLDYSFTGGGSITGPVGLLKNGAASLTLAESGGDNFSGGITNNAGTIVLDDANSAIAGGLFIAGGATVQIGNHDANGALPAGGLDDEGTLIFDRTDNVLVATVIPGGGALSQNGSGALLLSAVNTYTGNTTVSNGTLALTNAGSISLSAAVVVTNATLDASGATGSTTLGSLYLTNASLDVKVGYLQTNLIVASLTMGGAGNTLNVRSLPPIASYPATLGLLQSATPIIGYNFVQGSLPSASPTNAGTIALSADQTAVLLTLTAGPIGVRPSVTWSGVDALSLLNTNWSDAQNWLTPGVPAPAEKVFFNDTAAVGGSPFDNPGDGSGGIVNPANINNLVDVSLTNAALSYANDAFGLQNTQIASGKTLTVNGNLTVSGAGGTVTILGAGAALIVNNPNNTTVFNVENGTAPTLDMSGLDTFIATVNQIGIGFNTASAGSRVSGNCYLARTNTITTGVGNFSTASGLVVGGSSGSTAGTGQLYLGQSNALYVDGIVLGASTSTSDLILFNPVLTGNPAAYIRGITGDSSRVTLWSLGDDQVNINNSASGSGFINDFSAGTLDALVGTLTVGRGAHGNTLNTQVKGTFNMGAGHLDVTTLNVGIGGVGAGGTGIGIMNVTGGTLVVNSVGLGLTGDGGGAVTTAGTLNLTDATLVVSNGIAIGSGTAGGTLGVISSTVQMLNGGAIGSPSAPLTLLMLDGATLQLSVNGAAGAANIVATTVTTNAPTTINIASIANVSGTVQIPLLSYTGTDPFGALILGTYPAGDTVALVDNTANSSIDLSISVPVPPTPAFTGVSVSGTTLTLTATNGAVSGRFVLLGSTNVTLPLSQWTPLLTNNFNGSGNLNLSTNILNPFVPQQFFILLQ